VKKVILIFVLILVLGATSGLAESTIQIFFVACADQGIVNFSDTIDPGEDVYYQVLSGGNAISAMRRAQLDGTVAFSERLPYNSGTTVADGGTASLRVIVASENDIEASSIDTTVNDVQDGCADPQNPVGTSVDATASVAPTTIDLGPLIVSPFGGFLNPDLTEEVQPIVVIGARPQRGYRSPTPGLIFAECTEAPRAEPGRSTTRITS
jgi:hypothetical protein